MFRFGQSVCSRGPTRGHWPGRVSSSTWVSLLVPPGSPPWASAPSSMVAYLKRNPISLNNQPTICHSYLNHLYATVLFSTSSVLGSAEQMCKKCINIFSY